MKYRLALVVCGVAWFGIAGLCYRTLFQRYPAGHLLGAMITAWAVGTLFQEKIKRGRGWRFFVLWSPAVLAAGVAIYGFLVPWVWLIFGLADGLRGVETKAFIGMPVLFLWGAFTRYFPILYLAALATNLALRWVLREEKGA